MTDKKNPVLNDVCGLVSKVYDFDAIGNQIEAESTTEIFCGEIAITMNEFYEAAQSDIRPETALIVGSMEYDGQRTVIFGGIRFSVVRVYKRLDEFTELYLQRK